MRSRSGSEATAVCPSGSTSSVPPLIAGGGTDAVVVAPSWGGNGENEAPGGTGIVPKSPAVPVLADGPQSGVGMMTASPPAPLMLGSGFEPEQPITAASANEPANIDPNRRPKRGVVIAFLLRDPLSEGARLATS